MNKKPPGLDDSAGELQPEYDLDYAKARPNRFANRIVPGGSAVVLEPDVASVFKTSQSVNEVLRALITAMPKQT
jgi:hypothetical protein